MYNSGITQSDVISDIGGGGAIDRKVLSYISFSLEICVFRLADC